VRPAETAYDELAANNDESETASPLIQQPDEFLSWWANPERERMNQLLGRNLIAAIETLPEAFREVVVLISIDGPPYANPRRCSGSRPAPSAPAHCRKRP